ncbi:MAG: YceD family protein [Sulfuricella sp.]|nr:YceD family protein [Sulfuricella sp.]
MDRLRDLLLSGEGELEYVLTGRRGENGKLYLDCDVRGLLQLTCQRCLDALAYPLRVESELELAEGEQSQDAEELTDVIEADPALDVLALIEDEVLLALPMAPTHSPKECKADANASQAKLEKKNAFSALAALKTKD